MGKLSRAAGAARHRTLRTGGALQLVAGGRRDWAEAVWAEAHEVPWLAPAGLAGGCG